jgi:alpha-tubulin suppressor-like RCC1 family protein
VFTLKPPYQQVSYSNGLQLCSLFDFLEPYSMLSTIHLFRSYIIVVALCVAPLITHAANTNFLPPIISLLLEKETEVSGPVLAVGRNHACALLKDRTVQCWGANSQGQLGNNTEISSSQPVSVIGVEDATGVYAGYDTSCAILDDDSVKCWGDNNSDMLIVDGQSEYLTAITVEGLVGNNGFSINQGNICQVRPDQTLSCAGGNRDGQLGNGTFDENDGFEAVISINNAINIVIAREHACALIDGGTVKCWGDNGNGQLGIGSNDPRSIAVPTDVTEVDSATALALGDDHTCALLENKSVQCWGDNFNGQIGNGSTNDEIFSPQTVSGINSAIAIAANRDTTCAILEDKSTQCWGNNANGQLGNRDSALLASNIPVVTQDIINATQIELGEEFACALINNNGNFAIQCWGDNAEGQIGTKSFDSIAAPTAPSNISKAVTDVVTGSGHSCALYDDGTIDCWGRNARGELGIGSLSHSTTPITVPDISTAVAIGSGGFTTCAVLSDGTVKCWGRSLTAQVGAYNPEESLLSPVSVPNINTATSVKLGTNHACAILSDADQNTIACWGKNDSGQLGVSGASSSLTPVEVSDISSAVSLTLAANYSCAILLDGTVRCWGANRNDVRLDSSTSVSISSLNNVTALATEAQFACAIVDSDEVFCWGDNDSGQLGNSGADTTAPVKVAGVSNAVQLGTTQDSTCVATNDGMNTDFLCWGSNRDGALGINDLSAEESASPLSLDSLGTVDVITSHGGHSCALTKPSNILCWGRNFFGGVGNGTRGFSIMPNEVKLDLK